MTKLTEDPVVREAIEVSSGSLAATLNRIRSGESLDSAKVERAALATTRYVLRMTGRPTPFGLMAGVALARFADVTSVRVGTAHRKSVRPDAEWLASLCARWTGDEGLRHVLRLVANDLCYLRGDRLVLPSKRSSGRPETSRGHELTVRFGPAVRAAMEATRQPIEYGTLVKKLRVMFPRVAETVVTSLLGELIEYEFLLTDLRPTPAQPGDICSVLDRVSRARSADVARLREVHDLLATYRDRPLGQGVEQFRAAAAAMRLMTHTKWQPIHVDLLLDADVHLPRSVAEEVERAATALWRLRRSTDWLDHLAAYHEEFVERYGLDRMVPILELLDPNRGLGPPATYISPPGHRGQHAPNRGPGDQPGELRAALLQSAIMQGHDEIILDDDLVEQLAADERIGPLPPPERIEMFARLFAGSASALDRGEFRIVLAGLSASLGAGPTFGRFIVSLGGVRELSALVDRSDEETGPLTVQVCYQPSEMRVGNLWEEARLTQYMLPIGMYADRSDDTVIDVRDVAVGADEHSLRLVWTKTGRELAPVALNLIVAPLMAPNAARLILDIGASRAGGYPGWRWGALERLPYLPRVRYGRTVLTPAMWRPDASLREATSWSQFCTSFDGWRRHWGVPNTVEVAHGTAADRRIPIDLTVPMHRRLLRSELRRDPDTSLIEDLQGGGDATPGWLSGHANEIVVPLFGRRAHPPASRRGPQWTPAPERSIAHHPGGRWLYLKVYAAEEQHDTLLAGEVSSFVASLPEGVRRWFFIRYADPRPHLRLRFHGDPSLLNGELLPAVHEWAERGHALGLLENVVIDTYEPEVDRYGGPAALDAAEEVFHADSDATLVQLRLRERGELDVPAQLLAAMNYADLLIGLGELAWEDWVIAQYAKSPRQTAFRTHRHAALRYLDPHGGWTTLRELAGTVELLPAWQRRAESARNYGKCLRPDRRTTAIGSLLHMHHNRLIGPRREVEDGSYAILRGVAAAHIARRDKR